MILELTEGNMPDTNNSISLSGRVTDGPEYSHTIYGEAFFKLVLTVQRLSGTEDKIPVTVSERLLGGIPVEHGMYFMFTDRYVPIINRLKRQQTYHHRVCT